jgi:3-dehydroquinate dehydratase-2
MALRLLLVNGPNLNKLGERQPEIYGRETLIDIEAKCREKAEKLGFSLDTFQSNHEGELVSKVQEAGKTYAGVLLNAGAYTHTSVALLDALLTLTIPVIEVHLSNPSRREEFRHHSYISKAATGVIAGFGANSYLLALDAMSKLLEKK